MFGWPQLVHFCQSCRRNTTVTYSPTVWTQEHVCQFCGVHSTGADIAGETSGTMNYSQHDELAQLFAQRLTFAGNNLGREIQHQHDGPTVEIADSKIVDDQPVTFVSTHYTHTNYITRTDSESSRSPPPPSYTESIMSEEMAQGFRDHSIDPASLLPNQINLFTNADYEQRLRLLELWRISPPRYVPSTVMSETTSMEQEENSARVRYEADMAARITAERRRQRDMDFDTHEETISPIREAGEPAWPPAARMRAASIANQSKLPDAEPYIVSGYQDLHSIQRHNDPVYAASSGVWNSPLNNQQVQQDVMAGQFGSVMQVRNHADWEAMNARIANDKLTILVAPHSSNDEDDDMIM